MGYVVERGLVIELGYLLQPLLVLVGEVVLDDAGGELNVGAIGLDGHAVEHLPFIELFGGFYEALLNELLIHHLTDILFILLHPAKNILELAKRLRPVPDLAVDERVLDIGALR